jgi:hypothetical protein
MAAPARRQRSDHAHRGRLPAAGSRARRLASTQEPAGRLHRRCNPRAVDCFGVYVVLHRRGNAPSHQHAALDHRTGRTGRADLAHRERTGYAFEPRRFGRTTLTRPGAALPQTQLSLTCRHVPSARRLPLIGSNCPVRHKGRTALSIQFCLLRPRPRYPPDHIPDVVRDQQRFAIGTDRDAHRSSV